MSKDRWNSGLAQSIAHQTTLVLDPAERHADAVEELIDSCAQIDLVLKTIAEIYPDLYVDSAPAVTRFRAAVRVAKNWK